MIPKFVIVMDGITIGVFSEKEDAIHARRKYVEEGIVLEREEERW